MEVTISVASMVLSGSDLVEIMGESHSRGLEGGWAYMSHAHITPVNVVASMKLHSKLMIPRQLGMLECTCLYC